MIMINFKSNRIFFPLDEVPVADTISHGGIILDRMGYRCLVATTSYFRGAQMPNCKGAFHNSKDSWGSTFYCSIANLPPDQQKYIPVDQWAEANNCSVFQCRKLLRKGQLLGFQFKGKFYVCPNPNNPL